MRRGAAPSWNPAVEGAGVAAVGAVAGANGKFGAPPNEAPNGVVAAGANGVVDAAGAANGDAPAAKAGAGEANMGEAPAPNTGGGALAPKTGAGVGAPNAALPNVGLPNMGGADAALVGAPNEGAAPAPAPSTPKV